MTKSRCSIARGVTRDVTLALYCYTCFVLLHLLCTVTLALYCYTGFAVTCDFKSAVKRVVTYCDVVRFFRVFGK